MRERERGMIEFVHKGLEERVQLSLRSSLRERERETKKEGKERERKKERKRTSERKIIPLSNTFLLCACNVSIKSNCVYLSGN